MDDEKERIGKRKAGGDPDPTEAPEKKKARLALEQDAARKKMATALRNEQEKEDSLAEYQEQEKTRTERFLKGATEVVTAAAVSGLKTGCAQAVSYALGKAVEKAYRAHSHVDEWSPASSTQYTAHLFQEGPFSSYISPPAPTIIFDTPSSSSSSVLPTNIGMEGPVFTTGNGQHFNVNENLAELENLTIALRGSAGKDQVIAQTCTLADTFRQITQQCSELDDADLVVTMANINRALLINVKRLAKALGKAGANIVSSVAHDITHPVEFSKTQALAIMDTAQFLISEMAKIDALENAFPGMTPEQRMAAAQACVKDAQQQQAAIDAMLAQLKAMQWDELVQHGAELMGRGYVDLMTGRVLGIGIKLGSAKVQQALQGLQKLKSAIDTGITTPAIREVFTNFAIGAKLAAESLPGGAGLILQAMGADAEFMSSETMGRSLKDKIASFCQRFHQKRLFQAGAQEVTAAEYLAQERVATEKYEAIRQCSNDINKIAQNTGMPVHKIARIKQHVFLDDTHILEYEGRIGRFAPSKPMADVWERLENGTFTPNDIKLLEHEYFESKFEKLFKTTGGEAHQRTEASGRRWIP